MNLITNASEALGETEGVISISVAAVMDPDGIADRQLTPARGEWLRLAISDTGSGMTQTILSKIFDPFYTTKFSGRGLGLAAVQGIIDSHNGEITVTSAPGQGSQFEILLPCTMQRVPDTSQRETPGEDPDLGGLPGTVLVIEDEDVLRQAVAAMLRKRGFRVIEAGDGATGTELFLNSKTVIDAILLDMTLPVRTGAEVLEAIREVRPDVRVILTSAYGPDTFGGKQLPWAYIRKPYRINELIELLHLACQRTSL
jgi:CheY-like chemotaxis protein